MTAGPPGRGEGWPLGRPRPRSAVPGIPAGFSTEDHVLTTEQHIEDVRRHIAARIDQTADVHASLLRRRQLVRRTAMFAGLFCSSLQYYFFTVGLEILSMPGLSVFVPVVRLG
jgi:hypothetical protein